MHQRHHDGETFVRAAEHSHLAVALGHVLHEPVDRVVRVGRMIDGARVQRSLERPGHHVVAFRPILAAHVLEHADVAVHHEDLVALRQRPEHPRRWRPLRSPRCVVGRTRQDQWRLSGSFGHDDDGVQFHTVAHRNHDVALDVIVRLRRLGEVRRHIRRQGRRLGAGGRRHAQAQGAETGNGREHAHVGQTPRSSVVVYRAGCLRYVISPSVWSDPIVAAGPADCRVVLLAGASSVLPIE